MYDLGFIRFEEKPAYFSSYSEYEQSLCGDAPKEVASLDYSAVLEILTAQGLEVLRRHHKQLGTNWVLVYGLQER